MSETAKTMTFVGIGLAAVVLALLTRPTSATLDKTTLIGNNLTAKFSSPDDAKRLKVVRFNEDTATLREFEVAEGPGGLWTIPSKDGYPADAKQQMAQASMSLKDRDILGVQTDNPADHELYGVIDPLSPKLKPGQKGVGTRVSLFDSNNDPLVDLIIGKPRKDAEGQHFVREAGRDVVYVINVDPQKLSTSFEDWIEKDLLKLEPYELEHVEIKDYSAELVAGVGPDGQFQPGIDWNRRADMTLSYNDKDAQWQAVSLQSFDPKTRKYVDFKLAEDEEINATSLNALKTALDDLKIVDVVRKPQGLSDDLKAGEDFLSNVEARRDLIMRGFTPTSSGADGAAEFISSDGEVIATLKNGAEYILRFGNLTSGPGDEKEKQAKDATPADKTSKDSEVHRYLFVMARYNENAVKRPELQPLPDLPAGTTGEAASAASKEDAKASADADTSKKEADKKEADKPADAKETEDATAEEKSASGKPADATEDATKSDETSEKEKEVQKIMAERKRIEDENQRKQKEYDETVAKGRERVKELNARFGDWYFVVDNDIFNKVRLGREGVVKKKAAKDAAHSANPAGAPGTGIPGLPALPGAGN